VKERMLHKEKEVKGKWVTREKMEKSGDYSRCPACMPKEKCRFCCAVHLTLDHVAE